MAVVSLTIHLGTISREWCDSCLTSARIRVPLITFSNEGVTQIGEYAKCQRCSKSEDQ